MPYYKVLVGKELDFYLEPDVITSTIIADQNLAISFSVKDSPGGSANPPNINTCVISGTYSSGSNTGTLVISLAATNFKVTKTGTYDLTYTAKCGLIDFYVNKTTVLVNAAAFDFSKSFGKIILKKISSGADQVLNDELKVYDVY